MQHQIRTGTYLGPWRVRQAHIMADTEALGETGVAFLERFAAMPSPDRHVQIPTITNPRGTNPRGANPRGTNFGPPPGSDKRTG